MKRIGVGARCAPTRLGALTAAPKASRVRTQRRLGDVIAASLPRGSSKNVAPCRHRRFNRRQEERDMAEMAPMSRADRFRVGAQHWLAEEWTSVLFIVCLVMVLHHAGPLKPLSRLSLLLLMNWQAEGGEAAWSVPESAPIWLVAIDMEDFESRFQERRPLQRCELLKDLGIILDARPDVLAIDLDLSPLKSPTKDEERCQDELNRRLKGPPDANQDDGPPTQVVLIQPFETGTNASAREKEKWKREIASTNVHFSNAEIQLSFNFAIDFKCDPSGFAETAYEFGPAKASLCGEHSENSEHSEHERAISYRALQSLVHQKRASALASPLMSLRGKTVLYGTRADADRAVTPIGKTHGVVVHAAKLATLEKSVYESALLGFGLDLLFAIAYSVFASVSIRRYLALTRSDSPPDRARRSSWLLGFALCSAIFASIALAIAYLAIRRDVVIEPLLITLGLAIDGLVVAGWSHVGTREESHVPRFVGWREALQSPWLRSAIFASVVLAIAYLATWSFDVDTEPLLIALVVASGALVVIAWSLVGASAESHAPHLVGWWEFLKIQLARYPVWKAEVRAIARVDLWVAILVTARWMFFWIVVALAVYYLVEGALN